jgi:hypothetical protein
MICRRLGGCIVALAIGLRLTDGGGVSSDMANVIIIARRNWRRISLEVRRI